jgi:hypothetical protein
MQDELEHLVQRMDESQGKLLGHGIEERIEVAHKSLRNCHLFELDYKLVGTLKLYIQQLPVRRIRGDNQK